MISPFERMVAFRYLRARRQEGFISVIAAFSFVGIALGVATLIVVLAVMTGFREELLGRILGLNGHITVATGPQGLANPDELAERVRQVPGVVSAIPVIEGQVMATANSVASGVLVRAMRLDDLARKAVIAGNVRAGSLDELAERPEDTVAIGSRLAARMGLAPGGEITLISPQGTETAFGTVPRLKAFRVGAVFEVGMFEYDNNVVVMPLQGAQIYFRLPERASNLEIMVADPDATGRLLPRVEAAIGDAGFAYDWRQSNAQFFNALQVERNVMFLILTLIILVAAFNIVSSLIMLVKDKGRDIAILRTMGATRGAIVRVFVLTGATIGVTGTLLGVVLGLAFALNIETIRGWLQLLTGTELFAPEIYFLSQLPARVVPGDVLRVVAMALGLSFLASLYPSWRAARVDPVEALRYD